MSYLSSVVMPTGTPSKGGYLGSVVMPTAGQQAQATKAGTIYNNQQAAQQNAQANNTTSGIIKNTLNIGSLIKSAGGVFGGALKAATAPIVDTFVGSRDLTTGAILDASQGRSTTGGLLEGGKIVAGYAGMAYSPFAGILNPISKLIMDAGQRSVEGLAKTPPIDYVGRKIADIPGFSSPSTQDTATKILETLSYIGQGAMGIIGLKGGEVKSRTVPEAPRPAEVASSATHEAPVQPLSKVETSPEGLSKSPSSSLKVTPPETAQIDQSVRSSSAETTTTEAKAQAPLVDVKAAKAAADISDVLVEKGFNALPIEEQATFTPSTKAAQLEAVGNIMKDTSTAIKIAKGDAPVPTGVHPTVLFNAVVEHAQKIGDHQLLRDLANSPLAAESSLHAQQLGASGFNPFEHSPIKAIREIQQVRAKALKAKAATVVKRVKKAIAKTHTKDVWSDFVKSIEC